MASTKILGYFVIALLFHLLSTHYLVTSFNVSTLFIKEEKVTLLKSKKDPSNYLSSWVEDNCKGIQIGHVLKFELNPYLICTRITTSVFSLSPNGIEINIPSLGDGITTSVLFNMSTLTSNLSSSSLTALFPSSLGRWNLNKLLSNYLTSSDITQMVELMSCSCSNHSLEQFNNLFSLDLSRNTVNSHFIVSGSIQENVYFRASIFVDQRSPHKKRQFSWTTSTQKGSEFRLAFFVDFPWKMFHTKCQGPQRFDFLCVAGNRGELLLADNFRGTLVHANGFCGLVFHTNCFASKFYAFTGSSTQMSTETVIFVELLTVSEEVTSTQITKFLVANLGSLNLDGNMNETIFYSIDQLTNLNYINLLQNYLKVKVVWNASHVQICGFSDDQIFVLEEVGCVPFHYLLDQHLWDLAIPISEPTYCHYEYQYQGSKKFYFIYFILMYLLTFPGNVLYMRHIELNLKGKIIEYMKKSPMQPIIGFSMNNLSSDSEIPDKITQLIHLSARNLSQNKLTGDVHNIELLTDLESLNLSHDHLSGPIPATMTFFSHLVLSYNNLFGKNLLDNQFASSLFHGNGEQERKHEDDVDDKSERLRLYARLGVGYITSFWIACGSFVLKMFWRHAYFKFVYDMRDKFLVFMVVNLARLKRGFGLERH